MQQRCVHTSTFSAVSQGGIDSQVAATVVYQAWRVSCRQMHAPICANVPTICPAQVSVEALSPAELDYSLLEGKWLLQYTDALDVVST